MDTTDRKAINDMAAAIYRTIRNTELKDIDKAIIKEMALGIEQTIGVYHYLDGEWRNCDEAREAARDASKRSRAIWGVYKIEREYPSVIGKIERYRVAPVEQLQGVHDIINRYSDGVAWI